VRAYTLLRNVARASLADTNRPEPSAQWRSTISQ
jgi:hypothetical protein